MCTEHKFCWKTNIRIFQYFVINFCDFAQNSTRMKKKSNKYMFKISASIRNFWKVLQHEFEERKQNNKKSYVSRKKAEGKINVLISLLIYLFIFAYSIVLVVMSMMFLEPLKFTNSKLYLIFFDSTSFISRYLIFLCRCFWDVSYLMLDNFISADYYINQTIQHFIA